MAFPTTPLLDDFNRPDGGLGANWSAVVPFNETAVLQITTNQVTAPNSANGNYWLAAVGPDCEAYVDVPTASSNQGLYARLDTPGGSADGYKFKFSGTLGSIFRIDSGSLTQLGSSVSVTTSSGDSIGGSIIGSTLVSYHLPSGGAWATVDTASDATYGLAGFIGLSQFAAGGVFDNFGGGTVVAAAVPQPTVLLPRSVTPQLGR